MIEEQAFDPERHDRAGFTCGVAELDEYLRRFANQHRRRGFGTVFVLVDSGVPRQILGYYALGAAQVDANALDEKDRKGLPRYPVRCFRMDRLACRKDRQGEGLGRLLVACAVERCLQARKQVAAYALIVDAKSAAAKAFYVRYGLRSCADAPMTLYLPLGSGK